MAAFLLFYYRKAITRKFFQTHSDLKQSHLVDELTQVYLDETFEHFRAGDFSAKGDDTAQPSDRFLKYVRSKIFYIKHRGYDLLKKMREEVPVLVEDADDAGKQEMRDNTFDIVKGVSKVAKVDGYGRPLLASDPPDSTQQLLLQTHQGDAALIEAVTEAVKEGDGTSGEIAELMSLNGATVRQRLKRLRQKLRLQELESTLINQFNVPVPVAKTMARDILPLISILNQRVKADFPTSWAEAVQLSSIPKKRQVEHDRPKSQWISAVRCLFRLWGLEQGY